MKLSLVPRERRFFELFIKQGSLVSESLDELSKGLLEGRSRHPRLRDLEHECDDVTHAIYELVNRTFVTPIDQEDILELAASLDDIVDLAEEVADKLDLYRVSEVTRPAREVGECLAAAGVEIFRAMEELEDSRDLEARRLEVHRLENEGDRINREALAELFSDKEMSASDLIKWKDLYDLLENTMDKCEHVANVLEQIKIKNA
jgi:uncharacterized protein Yka (UPF0111/DUF47 family)